MTAGAPGRPGQERRAGTDVVLGCPVSVVMCVLNEERHLAAAVRHVLDQDYPGPVEMVIALGPSKDRTDEIAQALAGADPRVRLVRNPSRSGATPSGLNAAIAATRSPVVARIDGHAMLPPGYLRTAVQALAASGADNVGGIMAAEGESSFERAVARAMTSRLGVGNASFHTGGAAGPADTVYLGVFRRDALRRVGGYDEHFLRAQDWEMNLRIRRSGGNVWFTPDLQVSYRPRSSVRALARQYFHYGRWRRVVMRRHEGTVNLRYLAPPAALTGILAGTVAAAAGFRPAALLPAGYAGLVLAGAAVEGRGLPVAAWARLPVALATMHLSWGAGFLTSPRRLARQEPAAPGSGPAAAGAAAVGG
jgi:succinoglycan biosynthesis protein ExoA